MDESRFDLLTRSLAESNSRRRFLTGLAASFLGLVATKGADARTCSAPGSVCRENATCCSGSCGTKDSTGRRTCQCQAPLVACGNQCVDPKSSFQSDPKNCGGCGVRCPRTKCGRAACANGICTTEPDPAMEGKSCGAGQVCHDGICTGNGACSAGSSTSPCASTCAPNGASICRPTIEGATVCVGDIPNCEARSCTSSDDCGSGEICASGGTCGGYVCRTLC